MSKQESRLTPLLRRFWGTLIESLANGGAMGFVIPPLASLDSRERV